MRKLREQTTRNNTNQNLVSVQLYGVELVTRTPSFPVVKCKYVSLLEIVQLN